MAGRPDITSRSPRYLHVKIWKDTYCHLSNFFPINLENKALTRIEKYTHSNIQISYNSLSVGPFYETESELLTDLGQLGSLELVNFLDFL